MITLGDCIDVLRGMPEASVDSIVCDPPYGLEFMGKEWDALGGDRRQRGDATFKRGDARHGLVRHGGTASYGNNPAQSGRAQQDFHESWAREAFRVLKPGGYLVAFGGSRTVHRLACAIEDAGFEIRDGLTWLYGQGFPKSLDVSKALDKAAGVEREVVGVHTSGRRATPKNDIRGGAYAATSEGHIDLSAITAPATDDARKWEGWGTALKPAQEPIVVARKPLSERTVAANVLRHGTGALNIDGCRIGTADNLNGGAYSPGEREPVSGDDRSDSAAGMYGRQGRVKGGTWHVQPEGRWPANVVLSHVPDDFDEDGNEVFGCRCGGTREYAPGAPVDESDAIAGEIVRKVEGVQSVWECAPGCPVAALDAQVEGASRFFYQSKATNSERWGYCHTCRVVFNRGDKAQRAVHLTQGEFAHKVEYHPTVKPVDLMRWFVRLVTPPGGLIVDPFCGTGTTGEAAHAEGFQFRGIEREPVYAAIAIHRMYVVGAASKKLLPRGGKTP